MLVELANDGPVTLIVDSLTPARRGSGKLASHALCDPRCRRDRRCDRVAGFSSPATTSSSSPQGRPPGRHREPRPRAAGPGPQRHAPGAGGPHPAEAEFKRWRRRSAGHQDPAERGSSSSSWPSQRLRDAGRLCPERGRERAARPAPFRRTSRRCACSCSATHLSPGSSRFRSPPYRPAGPRPLPDGRRRGERADRALTSTRSTFDSIADPKVMARKYRKLFSNLAQCHRGGRGHGRERRRPAAVAARPGGGHGLFEAAGIEVAPPELDAEAQGGDRASTGPVAGHDLPEGPPGRASPGRRATSRPTG